ncbi:Predicted hydrolase of the alpha/beta superfamily [Tenacibaculum soleae]|uniref:alpha/beta hydrolase n=1 Tax=Tenacibaculum soleae TaxID=447689 RepID=UPI003AB24CB3
MKLKYILTLFLSTTQFISFSQEENEMFAFNSKFLKAKQTIQIYVPPAYKISKDRQFPVLYLLDGQEYFYYPIAYQNMLRFKDKSPAFIVVGINSDRKTRRQLYYKKSGDFMSFLEKELIPYIDSTYRTQKEKERLYFGWEMAGGLGLELCTKSPSLFSAYFIASPTHFSTKRLTALNTKLSKGLGSNPFFYITRANAKDDEFMEHRLVELRTLLKKNKTTEWKFDLLEKDSHYSTPNKTIHNGLRQYFNDYDPLRFFSLKNYESFGGIAVINEYYKKRADRYQKPNEIHKETKHFLLLQALKDDNYKQFEIFATTFSKHLKTKLSNDFWVNRFARFYMKHQKVKKAIELYNIYLVKFPTSALIYNSLGNAYKKLGKKKHAKQVYTKAIKLAKKQMDVNLKKYQLSLKEL